MMTELEAFEAREIASHWHSGQWSDLYAFASTGTIQSGLEREVETVVRECERRVADPAHATRLGSDDADELLEQARALLEYVTQPIVSVWSAYGHRFMSDGNGYESCLVCGAVYELVHDDADDPTHGAYVASNGDAPLDCSHDTGMAHGEDRAGDDHDCNCHLCAS